MSPRGDGGPPRRTLARRALGSVWAAWALAAGCAPSVTPHVAPPSPPSPGASADGPPGAALSGGLFTGGLAPIETGPSPRPGADSVGVEGAAGEPWGSADCTRCHREKGRQWSTSQHASAFDDAIFQVSWREWPNGWCVNCHLPRADDQRAVFGVTATPGGFLTPPGEPHRGYGPVGAAARRAREVAGASGVAFAELEETDGVGCPTCHVRGGEILAPSPPSLRGRLAHPMREEPALGTSAFCAGCHEFSFQRHTPAWPFSYGEQPLQATWSEWAASPSAGEGQTCQSCHMPGGDHSVPGGHDPALVRAAVAVEVTRAGAGAVEARLIATGAAHRVPTGDPFRRLVLEICAEPDAPERAPDVAPAGCDEPIGQAVFARRFQRTGDSWAMFEDTTIPPAGDGGVAERARAIDVDGEAKSWRLWYDFGDPRFHDMLTPAQVRYLVDAGPVP